MAPQATLENWLEPPHNRVGLRTVETLVRCAPIASGGLPVRELATVCDGSGLDDRRPVSLGDGQTVSLATFLTRSYTDSIIVLRGDEIAFERYLEGNAPDIRHIVMSISKSFCGTLAGIVIDEGLLDESAPVSAYVPELRDGSFASATVRQLLDMTAAPVFDMNYTGADTEVQAGDRCAGWRPRRDGDLGGTHEFLSALRGAGRHGAGFEYCSATTDVLAWVVERAAGTGYRRLMSERIWSRLGAEADAQITVDAHGTPYACAGMTMRLRDLARFGRMLLDGGSYCGTRVVPAGWLEATLAPGAVSTQDRDEPIPGGYRNQWWLPDSAPGVLYGVGIFGQYLWLDPRRDVVIAKFSSAPQPVAHGLEHIRALASLAEQALEV